MNNELKIEALEQVEQDVLFGFEKKNELVDSISEMFLDEEDFDKEWLELQIEEKLNKRIEESKNWSHPTDFEKLASAFDELIKNKIISLHKVGYTRQDAIQDCEQTVAYLNHYGIEPVGYCYYHSQDLERVIDPDQKNLMIGFDATSGSESVAIRIAHEVISVLNKNGFSTEWNGTVDQRIQITQFDWKKIPDDQNWEIARNYNLMKQTTKEKRLSWKFWKK